ncbi:MAG: hypothetical protein IPL58_12745 [Betaproteobacteria bacterium]|uniref:Uncharacterized protein n=1 Tax=Candidatus Proximibacter danicus TaxID=2954365 RepID=A0A9D7PTJ7_9PROT|nr:hypothetical protein [Candidatus Proximibacter danicus]
MHILLVLQERAAKRRIAAPWSLARSARAGCFGQQQLQPVIQLRGRGLLLQAGDFAQFEEKLPVFLAQ